METMKFKNISILVTLIIFTSYNNVFAYNGPKHHRSMGEIATEESDLDTYLKENLGFSKGVDAKFTNPEEPLSDAEKTKSVKEWIGYGGIAEDERWRDDGYIPPRVQNHFYDPVDNRRLTDPPTMGTTVNSLDWGRDCIDNIYSWAKAREYYYLALTSSTKEEREKYWALTFRTLGQVCHLVQDLGSPAHVRNDNHINGDPYEDWSISPEGDSFIKAILYLGWRGDNRYLYPVVGFNQFDDYWDTESGQGLAEFTNSNFVTKDTNLDKLPGDPHHYDNPQQTGLYVEPYTFMDSNGILRTVNVPYCTSNVIDNYASEKSVNPFNYLTVVSYWNFYTMQENPERRVYTLNSKCHQEYAKLLVPRTVGYSAGLLNYFFRGKLEVEDFVLDPIDQTKLLIKIKNITGMDTVNIGDDEDILDAKLSMYCYLYPLYTQIWSSELLNIPYNAEYDLGVEFNLLRLNQSGEVNIVCHGGHLGQETFENNQLNAICDSISSNYIMGWEGWLFLDGNFYDMYNCDSALCAYAGYGEDPDGSRHTWVERGSMRIWLPRPREGFKIKKAKLFLNVYPGDTVGVYFITDLCLPPIYNSNPMAIIPANSFFSVVEVDLTNKIQEWIDNGLYEVTLLVKFINENVPLNEYKDRFITLNNDNLPEEEINSALVFTLEKAN